MPSYSPTDAVHPAGIGTAPDFMARVLAGLIDDSWDVLVTAASWGAEAPDGRLVAVEVDPRRWERAPWVVCGRPVPSTPNPGAESELRVRQPWGGFTAAAADRIVAALRGYGALPPADALGK